MDYIRLIIFNLFKIKELSIFIEKFVPQIIEKIIIIIGLEKQNNLKNKKLN